MWLGGAFDIATTMVVVDLGLKPLCGDLKLLYVLFIGKLLANQVFFQNFIEWTSQSQLPNEDFLSSRVWNQHILTRMILLSLSPLSVPETHFS